MHAEAGKGCSSTGRVAKLELYSLRTALLRSSAATGRTVDRLAHVTGIIQIGFGSTVAQSLPTSARTTGHFPDAKATAAAAALDDDSIGSYLFARQEQHQAGSGNLTAPASRHTTRGTSDRTAKMVAVAARRPDHWAGCHRSSWLSAAVAVLPGRCTTGTRDGGRCRHPGVTIEHSMPGALVPYARAGEQWRSVAAEHVAAIEW